LTFIIKGPWSNPAALFFLFERRMAAFRQKPHREIMRGRVYQKWTLLHDLSRKRELTPGSPTIFEAAYTDTDDC